MKNLTLFLLMFIFFGCASEKSNEEINIVPKPRKIEKLGGSLTLKSPILISTEVTSFNPLAKLLKEDMNLLFLQESEVGNTTNASIVLKEDVSLAIEEYNIQIDNKIVVTGGSYHALAMGVTSLLQMGSKDGSNLQFPKVSIVDSPKNEYRGVMLDVARQWHSIETVKQVVELCRWYKIRYMQFHLTDDQSFTFPSAAYPKLASKGRHYTIEELKSLVEYAKVRGVTIIPEFDAPGHTTAMRKGMPELFGASSLGVIDMANEKVYEALEVIMKEMMDVFYTSPYFHIGADEAWLGNFVKEETTQKYIKQNNFDNAHDIYLNFMVRMNDIVKKYGKQTLIWESFGGTGSAKVQIPKDIIVMAWETMYQRPESLAKNGYTMINASWKPTYVTPGKRWNQKYIYEWNIRRWENHWKVTPSYQNPIQMDKSTPMLGGQMCSWEMSEEYQIPSIHSRVPAIAEVFWNGDDKEAYSEFESRYHHTDQLYSKIIFPVAVQKDGFTQENYEGIYYNRENEFGDHGSVKMTPLHANHSVRYTTDKSMPTIESPEVPETIHLSDYQLLRFGVFDETNTMIGYETVEYQGNAFDVDISGKLEALRDTNIYRPQQLFYEKAFVTITNLKSNSSLHYTVDGSTPTIESPVYQNRVEIDKSKTFRASCFVDGKRWGKDYKMAFQKIDFSKNITTNKKVTTPGMQIDPINSPDKLVDGYVDVDGFWDSRGRTGDVIIDLGKITQLSKVEVYPYWDGHRFYTYTVSVSEDGKTWIQVVDRSKNTEKASASGHHDEFKSTDGRYLKVTMLSNSSNPSVHLVEVRAF